MKNIAITCFVLIAVCVGLQAKKVVKAPYFMATNTSQIEFEKVTLGKDTTWIDAKIYSIPGEDCVFLPLPYSSAEELSKFFAETLAKKLAEKYDNLEYVAVGVNEGIGQGAIYKKVLDD